MDFLSIFLTGIGLAMDALAVSLTIGLKESDHRAGLALKAGLYFGAFQGIMPLVGYFLGSRFSDSIEKYDHYVVFVLLLIIGGKMAYEGLFGDEGEEDEIETTHKTFLILAIATSIDALAVGVSFAFLKVNIFYAVGTIIITTFVIASIGVLIGSKFGKYLGSKAEVLGGVILILICTKILLEGLNLMPNFLG